MHRKFSLLGWLLLGALLSACATAPPHNPFKVERDEILARVKTVAMLPVAFPGKLDREAEVAKRYESLIAAELARLNFTVVPASEYAAIWDPMVAKVGGFFDPVTGEADQEKYKAVSDLAVREMVDRHGVDAFLHPRILVVDAYWAYNEATWHGVTESSTGREGFWASFAAPAASGRMGALSLAVLITDVNGEPYYVDYGGIQLLYRVSKMSRFSEVPEQELFADPSRDKRAVAISLAPLLGDRVAASR